MVTTKKGFTLIELLIVIGILAILATAAILVLNPARLFQEARDSQRISDFTALKNAIELYLATASVPSMADGADAVDCIGGTGPKWWSSIDSTPNASKPFTGGGVADSPALGATSLSTAGDGWVRVDLDSLSDGSPLAALPRDPRNSNSGVLTGAGMFYAYACKTPGLKYELNTRMESVRYANGGADAVESRDGGTNADIYEVGNEPGLDL